MICGIFGLLGFLSLFYKLGFILRYFKNMFFLIVIFIFYCFINITINKITIGEFYIFSKDIIYIIFAVWFLFFSLKQEELMKLKLIMEKLFYIQIPMIFFQYIYYNFILNLSSVPGTEDLPVALLGKQMTGHIGILTVFIGIDLIDKYIKHKNIKELIKIIILFILQFVMSVKVAILYWIVAILYVFRKGKMKISFKKVSLVLSLFIMFTLAASFFGEKDILSNNYLKFTTMQIKNFQEGYDNVRLSRISTILITLKYTDNTTMGRVLGNGIGTTKAAYQFGVYGRYYDVFSSTRYLGLLDNSFNFLYYEIGMLGILILILYFLNFSFGSSKISKIKIFIFCSLMFYTHSFDNNFLTIYMSILFALALKERVKKINYY